MVAAAALRFHNGTLPLPVGAAPSVAAAPTTPFPVAAAAHLATMFPVTRYPIAGAAEHNVIYRMWVLGTLRDFYREVFSAAPLAAPQASGAIADLTLPSPRLQPAPGEQDALSATTAPD